MKITESGPNLAKSQHAHFVSAQAGDLYGHPTVVSIGEHMAIS
ncbi:hypothetical protein [Mesorhizobium sp. B2-3-4]|nr:hypothetical protein [Mesorhizobium sp. B2-3-4]